jgi:bifunctional DNA-binding transcriptional regulator/antitoxin component of YhaV-PrlF toxin-antitoxin module
MPARTPDRGYSGTPLPRKLGIKEGSEVLITAEGDHQRPGGPYDVIVLFALSRAEVERRFRKLAEKLEPNGRLWIGWPKRGSGIATDITENALRDIILPSGLVDNKVAAIDERWSGLQFVVRVKDRPARQARQVG